LKTWYGAGILILLGACANTAPQYYSLQVPSEAPPEGKMNPGYAISVQPVVIPQQVARPQIVVRTDSSGEVIPLNAALWAGPLEAQIRASLADTLTHRLNVVDVGRAGAPEKTPVWRIYVDVQRFDSLYDHAAQQEVVWRMVPQGMSSKVKERTCSAQFHMPVGTGMSALVEGHRRALAELADLIAQTLPAGPKSANKQVALEKLSEGVSFRGCVG